MEKVSPIKRLLLVCCLVGGFLGVDTSHYALAETAAPMEPLTQISQGNAAVDGERASQEIPRLPTFVYQRQGRPDPFLPFLGQEKGKQGAKPGSTPMGIQNLEPGQLNLVAIISGGHETLAMVQDSGGMGYVLKKGSVIGRTGTVKEILPNKVLIEQVEQTPTSTVTRVVEMLLREGEKE